MFEYDRSNFISFLREFPQQIKTSEALMKKAPVNIDLKKIQNIVLAGMGGSAISGDLLLGYLRDELKIPAVVNRDYSIPGFVGKNTLFVATSCSGNTEETLAAAKAAIDRKATVVGISTGGKLEALCSEHNCRFIKVPGGLPPRQALGHLFFPLLLLFEQIGLVEDQKEHLDETYTVLKSLVNRYDPNVGGMKHMANYISQSIYHAIPVIYSGADHLNGMSVRWRNQFNENAKAMAFSNVLPELNHNEIVGWDGLIDVNKHFRVIFLRDEEESERVKQRIAITKDILRSKRILLGEIYSEGESRLARMFSLVCIGDWASYYWAMLNKADPIEIANIDYLKEKLSEQPATNVS